MSEQVILQLGFSKVCNFIYNKD